MTSVPPHREMRSISTGLNADRAQPAEPLALGLGREGPRPSRSIGRLESALAPRGRAARVNVHGLLFLSQLRAPRAQGPGPRLWGRVPSPKCSQVFNGSPGTPASPAKCRKAAKAADRTPATSLSTRPGARLRRPGLAGLSDLEGTPGSWPRPHGLLELCQRPTRPCPTRTVALSPLLPGTLRTELCPCSVPPALPRDVCQPGTAPRGAPARPAAPVEEAGCCPSFAWRPRREAAGTCLEGRCHCHRAGPSPS